MTATPVDDLRCMQPSSFATRRAQSAGVLSQRLVSTGVQDVWIEDAGRWGRGKGRMVKVEYFYDVDHPNKRYRKMLGQEPYSRLEPLHTVEDQGETSERLGAISRRAEPSGRYVPAGPDTVSLV